MMILTARGAEREFEWLFAKLGESEKRLAAWAEEMREGAELGFETAETQELFRQLDLGRMRMQTELHKARIGIRMGAHHWRTTLPFLKLCRRELGYLEANLNQFDAVSSAARAQVNRELGIN